jgi:cold shock CspA family protein
MFTGTVISSPGAGCWFIEQDLTHTSVFCHISQVADRRVLHIGDRISYLIAENLVRPGQTMAVNVTYIGRTIARQVSDKVQS